MDRVDLRRETRIAVREDAWFPPQRLQDRALIQAVQIAGWFAQQQKRRAMERIPAQPDALPLPAGEGSQGQDKGKETSNRFENVPFRR